MEQKTNELSQLKSKMAGDIKTVIADGQDLLQAAANVSGAGFAAARERFDEKLYSAKASLINASRPAVDKARKTAVAANGYVHGNPWAVISVAVAASALIGFLAAKRPFFNASQSDN